MREPAQKPALPVMMAIRDRVLTVLDRMFGTNSNDGSSLSSRTPFHYPGQPVFEPFGPKSNRQRNERVEGAS
ncbi:hypothetical protein FHS94_000649 [Sphingomonas aerophila]|uniref:Uncharacterized protein n=1 Tax=Sphingomonas aerophila TaxID=1344948 RepID=A0A7W9ET57_9SPHN|nr:hypothetical protein [Sphingomonas aerophila]